MSDVSWLLANVINGIISISEVVFWIVANGNHETHYVNLNGVFIIHFLPIDLLMKSFIFNF